ncbi:HEPN domain-containing protein [Halobellus rufus]|uniref:HEPN domain-containing protein n=1 Tax=Halobellus rufus TaxID=1448860 RepID=UPI0012E028C3|nr:HEPN domain-containing protein [Halobellus rufus]
MVSGKFRVRDFSTSDERVRRLEGAWREVIDTERYRSSPRQELVDLLESLQTTLIDQPHNRGKILEKVRHVEACFDDIQRGEFADIREQLDDYLEIDENQRQSDAERLQRELNDSVDYDESELETVFEDHGIEKSVDDFYAELGGVIAEFAKRESSVEADIEDLQAALATVISDLRTPDFRDRYKSALIQDIASFLHYEEDISQDTLRTIVAQLSAELRSDGWTFGKAEAVEQSKTDIDRLLNAFTTDEFDSHDERIDNLIDTLSGTNHGREYYIPLPDCDLDVDRLFAGQITIYDQSHSDFDLRDRLKVEDESAESDEAEYVLPESFVDHDLGLADKFAYMATTGPVRGVTRKAMREELSRVLDALNFYRDHGLIASPFQQPSYIFYEFEPDGTSNRFKSWNQRYGHRSVLSTEQVRNHVDRQQSFFNISDNPSELEQGYKNSLRWFRYGLESYHPEDQFLKFIIALENVLVPDRAVWRKKEQLAERAMRLLQIMPKFEEEYRPIFEWMYDIRSQIVHDAARDFPELERDVKRLQSRTRMILDVVRSNLDSCDTITDVIDEIEAKEAALREGRQDQAPMEVGDTIEGVGILTDSNGLYYGNVAVQASLQDDGRYLYYDGEVTGLRNVPDHAVFELMDDPALELYIDGELYRTENLRFLNDGLTRDVLQASEEHPIPVLWLDVTPVEGFSLQDGVQTTPFATVLPAKLRMYSDGTRAQFIIVDEEEYTDEFPHSVQYSFDPRQDGAYHLFHIDAMDRDEFEAVVEEYGEFSGQVNWSFSNTLISVSDYFEVCRFAKAAADDALESIQFIAEGRNVGELRPQSQVSVPPVDWEHLDWYRRLAQLEKHIDEEIRTLGFLVDEQIDVIESASNLSTLYDGLDEAMRPAVSWVEVEAETADGRVVQQRKLGPFFNPLHLPEQDIPEEDEDLVEEWAETRHRPFKNEVSTTMTLQEALDELNDFAEEWSNDISDIGETLHLPPELEMMEEPEGLQTRLKIRFEPVQANLLYLEQDVSYTITELKDE